GGALPGPVHSPLPCPLRPRRALPRGRHPGRGRAADEPRRRDRRLGPGAVKPAFYALARGGWRDYVTLLHPPYTLWHLSYVAVGAGLASPFLWTRCGAALLAFALALGVGAHALDELRGPPLCTQIPERTLWALAVVSIRVEAVAAALYAALLSSAQRILSTPVREARRQEGTVRPELEAALLALTAASIAVGAALLFLHL